MPRDIPLNCLGVDSRTILNPPTCVNDNPVAIIASVPANIVSVECKRNILKNPIELIIVPISVGFIFPNLEITKPEEGANNRNTIINGSWIFAVVIASPSNPPTGKGLLTRIGIV